MNDLANLIKRVVIETLDDSTGVQTVQVSMGRDETADGCEHLQPCGVSFRVPAGSEGVALAPGGDPSHVVVILAAPRGQRPEAENDGEGGLHFLGEWKVYLDSDGYLHLGTQEADEQAVRGNAFKVTYDAHTHPSPFGPTDAPAPMPDTDLSDVTLVD
jgi:phage gp45-like